MGFFTGKKKLGSFELATELLSLVPVDDRDIQFPSDRLTEEQKLDIKFEITYLKIFTIDIAVSATLGDSPVKQKVLDSFYGKLLEVFKHTKGDMLGETKERFPIYEEAFNTPHHLGPPWTIGKAFSKFCGRDELDLDIAMTGSIHFGVLYKTVSELIKSHEIT